MSVNSSLDKIPDRISQPRKSSADKNEKKATKLTGNKDVFCWTCHRSNNLAPCSHCPRAFHLKCSSLEKFPEKAGKWMCPECDNVLRANKGPLGARTPKQVEKLAKLLTLVLDRLATVDKDKYFAVPVDVRKWHDYLDFVIKPMDLLTLRKNVERKIYRSTDQFLADFRWLVHNSYIFNSVHSEYTKMAKSLLNVAKHECEEVKSCQDCYEHAHTQDPLVSFILPCSVPHIIVWAQLSGFPYWPAKVIKRLSEDIVDVRFFGDHSRANVSQSSCFLYSRHMPANIPKKSSKNAKIARGIEEAEDHIKQLKAKFGSFHFAKYRVPFVAKEEEILRKLQLPGYSEPGESADFCKNVEELRPLKMINDKEFRSEVRDMKKKISLSSLKRKSSEFSSSPGFKSPKEFVFLSTPTGTQCAVVNWSGSDSDFSPDKKNDLTSPLLKTISPPVIRPKIILNASPSTTCVSPKSKRSSLAKQRSPIATLLPSADNSQVLGCTLSPRKVAKMQSQKSVIIRRVTSKRHQPSADLPVTRRQASKSSPRSMEKIGTPLEARLAAFPEASFAMLSSTAENTPEEEAKKPLKNLFPETSEEDSLKVAKDELLEVVADIPEKLPEEVHKNVPEAVPHKMSEEEPRLDTEEKLEEVPQDKPHSASESVSEDKVEHISQDTAEDVLQEVTEKGLKKRTEDSLLKESKNVPDKLSEIVPKVTDAKKLANNTPRKILEDIGDINVVVGNIVDSENTRDLERRTDVDVPHSSDKVDQDSINLIENPPGNLINLNGDISHYLLSVESCSYDNDSADEMEDETAYCKMSYKIEGSSEEADSDTNGIAEKERESATVRSTLLNDQELVKKLDEDSVVSTSESEQISSNDSHSNAIDQKLLAAYPASQVEPTDKTKCDISTTPPSITSVLEKNYDDSTPQSSPASLNPQSSSNIKSENADPLVGIQPLVEGCDRSESGNQALQTFTGGDNKLPISSSCSSDQVLTSIEASDVEMQPTQSLSNERTSNMTSRPSASSDHTKDSSPKAEGVDMVTPTEETSAVKLSATAELRLPIASPKTASLTDDEGKVPISKESVPTEGLNSEDAATEAFEINHQSSCSTITRIEEELSESKSKTTEINAEKSSSEPLEPLMESFSKSLGAKEDVSASPVGSTTENQPTEKANPGLRGSIKVVPLSQIELPTLKRKSPPETESKTTDASEPKKSKSGDHEVHLQSDIIIASSMSLINNGNHVEVGQPSAANSVSNRKRTRLSSKEAEQQKKTKDSSKDVAMPIPLIEVKTEPIDYDEMTEDSPPLAKEMNSAKSGHRNSVSAGTRIGLKIKPISSLIETPVTALKATPPPLVPLATKNPRRPTTPKHNMIPPFTPQTSLKDVRDLIQSKAKFINRGLKDDLIAKLTNVEQEYENHLDFVTSFAEKNLKEVELNLESNKAKMYVEMKNKIKEEMGPLLVEARRKQWCVKCGAEANFHCCWSYSYCSDRCQKGDWPSHVQVCTQYQMDVKDPRVKPSPHFQSVIEFISRQIPGSRVNFKTLTEFAQSLPSPSPPPRRVRNVKPKVSAAGAGQKMRSPTIGIPHLAPAEPSKLLCRPSEGLDQIRLSNCKTFPVKFVSQSNTSSSISSTSSSGGKYFVLQHPMSKNVGVASPTTSNGLAGPISSPSVSAKSLPNFGKPVNKPPNLSNNLRIAPNLYARNSPNTKGTLRIMNEGELASILKRNNLKL